jgi:hypothetical protein
MKKLYSTIALFIAISLGATAQTVSMTFTIDMAPFLVDTNTIIPDQSVRIAGNFQVPTIWDPSNDAYKLTRVGETNVYTGTIDVDITNFASGLEFKFLSRNAWGECNINQECNTGACTNGNNDNRFIATTGLSGSLFYTTSWNGCADGEFILGGLNSFQLAANLNVFPNPSNGIANLSYTLNKAGNTSVEVINTLGERVSVENYGFQNAGNYNYTIGAENLAKGLYIVRLTNGSNFATRTIAIQ